MKTVTAAILIQSGKVLLAQRTAKDPLGAKWEFPGGKVEPGETLDQCLARELQEELGVEVSVKCQFMESRFDYQGGSIKLVAFFVDWRAGAMSPHVHQQLAWVPIARLTSYNLLPADIPIALQLERSARNAVRPRP